MTKKDAASATLAAPAPGLGPARVGRVQRRDGYARGIIEEYSVAAIGNEKWHSDGFAAGRVVVVPDADLRLSLIHEPVLVLAEAEDSLSGKGLEVGV